MPKEHGHIASKDQLLARLTRIEGQVSGIDELMRRAQLLEGELIRIEFTPEQAGEYELHCGMGMLRGKVVAR